MAEKLGSALLTWLFFLILTFTLGHEALEQRLDSGRPRPLVFTGEKGRTYKCIQTSINFRIHGHIMTLIKVEGAHTMQEVYESVDVHDLGQSVTVIVALHAHQPTKDFFIVVSSHFTKPVPTATEIVHYFGSKIPNSKPLPIGPICHVHWSIKRARTIRLNWIANAARPNPQGSSHHGSIPIEPCTYKKSPTERESFAAGTKACGHAVHVLPRNRRLLGKLPDVNVHSSSSTSNEKNWNLDKKDPPSPPSPTGNPSHHP